MFASFDFAMPGVLFALNVGALMSLFFLASNPIMLWGSVIALPLTIFFAAGISNAYESGIATLPFGGSAYFPIMALLFTKLPIIMFVFDILGTMLLIAIIKVAQR